MFRSFKFYSCFSKNVSVSIFSCLENCSQIFKKTSCCQIFSGVSKNVPVFPKLFMFSYFAKSLKKYIYIHNNIGNWEKMCTFLENVSVKPVHISLNTHFTKNLGFFIKMNNFQNPDHFSKKGRNFWSFWTFLKNTNKLWKRNHFLKFAKKMETRTVFWIFEEISGSRIFFGILNKKFKSQKKKRKRKCLDLRWYHSYRLALPCNH